MSELLLREARELIEHHDRVEAAMAAATGTAGSGASAGLIRIGILRSPFLGLQAGAIGRIMLNDSAPERAAMDVRGRGA